MKIEGEVAARWTAVRLDTLESVEGRGVLLSADTDTGEVVWRDRTGETCRATLGQNTIRLVGTRR